MYKRQVLDRLDQDWLPVAKSWRLNEKHYGMLQGLNKSETAQKYGDEQVLSWRRSYDVAPPPLAEDDPANPKWDPRYKGCLLYTSFPRKSFSWERLPPPWRAWRTRRP